MYNSLLSVYNALTDDEELLRLVYYPPENPIDNTPDPLDKSLNNVRDLPIQEFYKIRTENFKRTPKEDDLTNKRICRIYIYSGRRRSQRGNYLVADQNLTVDCLIHNSFQESDLRLERISDRINKVLVHSRITGMGEIEYIDGGSIGAPKEYVGYRHIYKFATKKK